MKILVTGGSQGARIFSDIVPAALGLVPEEIRRKLMLVQQARGEDADRVRRAYAGLGVDAEVQPFFPDLPARIAQAHLVIARSGASTVSELTVIGRPAILVPLPHALDQDQAANARQLAEAGAATIAAQSVFSPQWLATSLIEAHAGVHVLAARAAAARRLGIPDAAERLAGLVQGLINDRKRAYEVAG
jgi:UDP-N-acetylglucosamine--N-acetylmuramyl-(pentapeptide) pyrophosphoryl-undecaprenol N-acetylglucosamine transferase